jgi:hypothetical protein
VPDKSLPLPLPENSITTTFHKFYEYLVISTGIPFSPERSRRGSERRNLDYPVISTERSEWRNLSKQLQSFRLILAPFTKCCTRGVIPASLFSRLSFDRRCRGPCLLLDECLIPRFSAKNTW